MAEAKTMRLNKVLREFNISLDRAVDFLNSKGHEIDARPTTKISPNIYQLLFDEFQTDKSKKVASKEVGEEKRKEKEALRVQIENEQEEKRKLAEAREVVKAKAQLSGPKQVGKIELEKKEEETPQPEKKVDETPKKEEVKPKEPEVVSNRPAKKELKITKQAPKPPVEKVKEVKQEKPVEAKKPVVEKPKENKIPGVPITQKAVRQP